MATTTLMSNTLGNVTIDGSIAAFITGWSLNGSNDFQELQCLTMEKAGTVDYMNTGQKNTFSMDGWVPKSAGVTTGQLTYWDIYNRYLTTPDASYGISLIADVSTQKYETLVGKLSSISKEVAGKSVVTFKCEFMITGKPSISTTV